MIARENPFRSERIEAIAFRLPQGASDLRRRLSECLRGLIVGPHGSGKTTLLEELRRDARDRGIAVSLVRLSLDVAGPRPFRLDRWSATADPCGLWLLDGAEQLSLLDRLRLPSMLTRPQCGFVLTAHRSLRGVPTLLRTSPSVELLDAFIRELDPAWEGPSSAQLFARHGGNIRHALQEAYDIAAVRR